MLRRSLGVALALLAIFHACVLASQAWGGELADPGLVLRWAVGGGLVAVLGRRWQRRAPILTGRRPVAIWLLAALLHGPAVFDGHAELPGQPAQGSVAVQIAAAASAAVLALGLGLALVAVACRLRRTAVAGRLPRVLAPPARRSPVARLAIAPRPPPVVLPTPSFA